MTSKYNESSPENEPESHKENTAHAVQSESAAAVERSNSLKRSADEETSSEEIINRLPTEGEEQIEIRTRETDPISSIFSTILNMKIHSRPETITSEKFHQEKRQNSLH